MKILIISDIHSNFEALKVVEPYIKNSDISICLGDIVGYYCQVNEVIDFLKKNQVICILGNHDDYVIKNENMKNYNESVAFGIKYAKKNINNANLNWLKSLRQNYELIYNNKKMFFCHANPWNNYEYLYPNNPLFEKTSKLEYDLIAFGHTHRAFFSKNHQNKIIINPGSIGQSREIPCYAEFAIFNTEINEITKYNIKYDFTELINLALKNGAESFIYKHLQ